VTDQTDEPPRVRRGSIAIPDVADGPRDANTPRRAVEFMSTVRQLQCASGRSPRGRLWLSAKTVAACARESRRRHHNKLAPLACPPGLPPATLQRMYEAFEEMCRRQQITLPTELRSAVYRLLTAELALNSYFLQAAAAQLVGATVYSGSLLHLPKAFTEFGHMPYVFRHAAIHRPMDPEGFLRQAQKAIARLKQDERFAALRHTPSIFAHAAVNNSKDPEKYLLRHLSTLPARPKRFL
jgi:hypothetical protein